MSDHIQQQYRGQTFDKAVAGYLRGKLLVSGYEPRTGAGERFWWGILENTDGTKTVACGRVTNFDNQGWGYKIGEASAWEPKAPNPPLNVRKALVKHGLALAGVHSPGTADSEFSLMMRDELTAKLREAVRSHDDAYILDAISALEANASGIVIDIIQELASTVGRKKPEVSDAVLDAVAINADRHSARDMLRLFRQAGQYLSTKNAGIIFPLLDQWNREDLVQSFPELSEGLAA